MVILAVYLWVSLICFNLVMTGLFLDHSCKKPLKMSEFFVAMGLSMVPGVNVFLGLIWGSFIVSRILQGFKKWLHRGRE